MLHSLQPQLSHQFAGVIWRMEIDAGGTTLALEVRNEQDKQVTFAAVDLQNNRLLFENYQTEERWLAGLEGVFNNVLLLHYYKGTGSPEHRGIIAVDAVTGRELWNNYNLAFHHFATNGIVVYDSRLQPRKLQLADIHTGKVGDSLVEAIDNELNADVKVPELSTDEGGLPEPAFGNIVHRLYYKQYIIVSLHAQAGNSGLVQKLFILANGQVCYTDLLNTGIQKLQPEAFVLQNNQLIYLKDRSQLKIINL